MAAANTSGGSSVMVVSFICVSRVAVVFGEDAGVERCAGVSVKGGTVGVVVGGRAVVDESGRGGVADAVWTMLVASAAGEGERVAITGEIPGVDL